MGAAIFGSFDGLTSVLGMLVCLLGAPLPVMISGAAGLAVSSAVGMGAGEYLGDDNKSKRNALIMALSTLVGTLIPILPFLFLSRNVALGVATVLVIAFGVVVSEARCKSAKQAARRSYVETFVILFLAACAAVLTSILTGASG